MIPDEPNDQIERRMHGVDERITTENLVFGATTLYEIIKRFSN
jgi:acetylornithine deacetylase/succinyl-diaminopimelate desuccinylase-like protein